ncbi:hypothetical protein FQN54_004462 [Arachnomyces sp. PD_36]|nr:hypothetical protein FQN54_004462 [Arachnomyces sp. PD_36]
MSKASVSSTTIEKKRKRETKDADKPKAAQLEEGIPQVDEGSSKKKKRRRNKQIVEEVNDDGKKDGVDESIGKMDGRLLADFFAQQAKRSNDELTAVELSDLYIPEQAFLDTSSWDSSRKIDDLPAFLKKHTPSKGSPLSKAADENGSPHTLVVTLAGLRAADLTRALRTFQNQNSAVGKLFAKHIKLKEAKEYVAKTRMGMGVGTPARISDLINADVLKLEHLKRIVIDASYIDQKKRGIFDMKEVFIPLLQLLTRADLRDRYTSKDEKVHILVF